MGIIRNAEQHTKSIMVLVLQKVFKTSDSRSQKLVTTQSIEQNLLK